MRKGNQTCLNCGENKWSMFLNTGTDYDTMDLTCINCGYDDSFILCIGSGLRSKQKK